MKQLDLLIQQIEAEPIGGQLPPEIGGEDSYEVAIDAGLGGAWVVVGRNDRIGQRTKGLPLKRVKQGRSIVCHRSSLLRLLGPLAHGVEAPFGLLVDIGRQRAFFRNGHIFSQMVWVEGSDDGGVDVRVRQQKPKQKGRSRFAL